jgi:hypothetical protein
VTTSTAASLIPLSILDDAWDDLLSFTRVWRDRIAKAQRGEFPWTGRGKN